MTVNKNRKNRSRWSRHKLSCVFMHAQIHKACHRKKVGFFSLYFLAPAMCHCVSVCVCASFKFYSSAFSTRSRCVGRPLPISDVSHCSLCYFLSLIFVPQFRLFPAIVLFCCADVQCTALSFQLILYFTHFAYKMENSIKSIRIQIRFRSVRLVVGIHLSLFFSLSLHLLGTFFAFLIFVFYLYSCRITEMPKPTIN